MEKNALTLLKIITDTFKCLVLPNKITDFFEFAKLRAYVPPCPFPFFTCLRAYNHPQNILRLTSIPYIAVFLWIICRSSHRRCSLRKGVLRNFVKFTGKHLCRSVLFNRSEACNFVKKETLGQVFSYEFCEISKNTFFTEHLWATASVFDLSFHSISQNKPLLLKLHTSILSCGVLLFQLVHVQKQ